MHELPPWVYIMVTSVTAVGVLLQAAFLGGMLFALKKALARLDNVSKMAEEQIVPTMGTARKMLEEEGPKIHAAIKDAVETCANLKAISLTARTMTAEAGAAVDDLLMKTETQAARVDEMLTGTLDSIAQATATLQRYVGGPSRQINALINGLRAGFDVLRSRGREAHAAADGEHFV